MNERIKQLAKQAGFSTELSEAMTTRHNTASGLEKFAELIVRQCINKIENEAEQYAAPTWAFEIVNDIKETFGVEE